MFLNVEKVQACSIDGKIVLHILHNSTRIHNKTFNDKWFTYPNPYPLTLIGNHVSRNVSPVNVLSWYRSTHCLEWLIILSESSSWVGLITFGGLHSIRVSVQINPNLRQSGKICWLKYSMSVERVYGCAGVLEIVSYGSLRCLRVPYVYNNHHLHLSFIIIIHLFSFTSFTIIIIIISDFSDFFLTSLTSFLLFISSLLSIYCQKFSVFFPSWTWA